MDGCICEGHKASATSSFLLAHIPRSQSLLCQLVRRDLLDDDVLALCISEDMVGCAESLLPPVVDIAMAYIDPGRLSLYTARRLVAAAGRRSSEVSLRA